MLIEIKHRWTGAAYRVGETVRPDSWCDDYTKECAGGVHFYITKEEAVAHD